MTSGPQDPFTSPQGDPPQAGSPSGYGTPSPAYGAPGDGAPGYGTPPGYGAPAYDSSAGFGPAAGRPELASWGLRLGGYLIDVIILAVVTALISLVLGQELGSLAQIVLYYGLFGFLTGTTGQTPGRKVVGISVLREQDGQLLGAGMGIVRNICHILDALPLLLGFFWPLWDSKNQTFADKIVKSVVVKV